ncbi:MAG TPA: hypothetical protein VKP65_07545 [Rhodothermales bacterium]|nr:hypothetical protein [Rhodothermales bacterium]
MGIIIFLLGVGLGLGGCIPYAVGTTAQPAAPDEPATSGTIMYVPTGVGYKGSEAEVTAGYMLPMVGLRSGINEASDIGVRAPGLTGFVIDYKRRVAGNASKRTAALGLMGGAGVVNAGNHFHVEATVLASGPEAERRFVPYGGLRAMHVIPMNSVAVTDLPTVGGFLGLRIGTNELGISAELGVFYDSPALKLRDHDIIAVPSFTVHSRRFFEMFGY